MMGVSLLFPELLLVIVPLLFLLFWRGRIPVPGSIVRMLVIILLALLAAVPLARIGGRGIDLIVVADLSKSMPADSRERAIEIIHLLESQRETGDRVGIVTYGREARIERLPREAGETTTFVQQIDPDGSDLGGAISLAASLIPRERPGRIIVLSDGEGTGTPAAAAAHEATARGVPIDFRTVSRGDQPDVAVQSLDLPGVVDELEPFQFSGYVHADRTVDAEVVLSRNGVPISRTGRTLAPGTNQFTFRDVNDRAGIARYTLEVIAGTDRVPENNAGDGAVRVEAPAALLLVNAHGGPDNLSRALAAGRLRVQTAAAATMPRTLEGLSPYRAVVLENVPAGQIGPDALETLSRFSTDLGGGLLVTGGGASFGVGGYFKSALDPHLPVSMEIKNEHRKLSLAMAVVLDRSGSMAVPVGDGRTKMDLANLGTCAAIDTLGPFDEVAVIAVDSAAHVVTPLTSAEKKTEICDQVRTIESLGGGIFTYTALVTAATIVQESQKGTRHIVLFADAADAEEPGEYQRLLETLRGIGITVSVIGLGSEGDPDAGFLKDVASRGGGRMHFTQSPDDLPRLFAEEAITVARSSFVEDPTPARALADMVLLGDAPASSFPTIDGYNLTYLRPGATMGVVTTDEHEAPVLAFWHRGLGRIAALTAEVDGRFSPRLNAWRDFGSFGVGLGRWLLGGDPPDTIRASIDRRGAQGIVRLELDPDRVRGSADDVRAASVTIVPPDARRNPSQRLPLLWVGEDVLEARFPVHHAGVYFGAIQTAAGQVIPLAPLSLPYSPEFEPRDDPGEGRRTLLEMARISGGSERTVWDNAFSVAGLRNRQIRDLVIPLALAVLLLHVTEIAGRRLLLFPAVAGWIHAWRMPDLRPRWPRAAPPEAAPSGDAPASTATAPAAVATTVRDTEATPASAAMARAKARAKRRLDQR
jgi:Mg-chelatase subunit ChlD